VVTTRVDSNGRHHLYPCRVCLGRGHLGAKHSTRLLECCRNCGLPRSPHRLGAIAIWGFGQWAAKRNKELELQREQNDQANLSASMSRGMAELRAMRDMVDEVANAPLPPISTSAPSIPQRVVTPPPITSPRSVPPRPTDRNLYCIQCGTRHEPGQRYCGDCGSALRSS
jgi:hypothetical protein